MKAITIIQPWATLIAIGAKRFETRGWATKHRGDFAIHAGKKVDREACAVPQIKETLSAHGYTADTLPTGTVIAISQLKNCHSIHIDHSGDAVLMKDNVPKIWIGRGNDEYLFGWYADGRFAWELTDVKMLQRPIPAKGQQGIWNWNSDISVVK